MGESQVTAQEVSRLLMIAGESSGDQHGALLIRALKKKRPQLQVIGTGEVRCWLRASDSFLI